jgi:hypothetical protein
MFKQIEQSFSVEVWDEQIGAWMEVEDALRDALKQGIEREDVDPTWFE